jgi:sulfate permease, SulP family
LTLTQAHFWDLSAVAALNKVELKFRREGTKVEILGLNEASATIVERLGIHENPEAVELTLKH